MRIRRPIAVLFTLTVLFSGSATLTACGSDAGTAVEDSDDEGGDDEGDDGGEEQDD